MVTLSASIGHPTEGLVLSKTGTGKNHPDVYVLQLNDILARDNYVEDEELGAVV
jgi:hypothetical protein